MSIIKYFAIYICSAFIFLNLAQSKAFGTENSVNTIEWVIPDRFPSITFSKKLIYGIEMHMKDTGLQFYDALVETMSKPETRGLFMYALDGSGDSYPKNVLVDKVMVNLSFGKSSDEAICIWTIPGVVKQGATGKCGDYSVLLSVGKTYEVTVQKYKTDIVATARITVDDKLFLGLGDSYASGEGNPDYPAILGKTPPAGYSNGGLWYASGGYAPIHGAMWSDRTCHRSIYSHQSLAALKYAVDHPHTVTRFISYACSGAEVFDGLLNPQKHTAYGDGLDHGQLHAALSFLCKGSIKLKKVNLAPDFDVLSKKKKHGFDFEQPECPDGLKKIPDAIFLSVGGNDIGFARLVMWAISPETSTFLYGLIAKEISKMTPSKVGRELPSKLEYRYKVLASALSKSGLLVPKKNSVYQTVYPDPLYFHYADNKSSNCGGIAPGFESIKALPTLHRVSFQLFPNKVDQLRSNVITKLNDQIRKNSEIGFNVVDSYAHEFLNHGICNNGEENLNTAFGFPAVKRGVWDPNRPTPDQWVPYQRRQSWFRLSNASTLNGIYWKNAQCDPVHGYSYCIELNRGLFHPTAEGQAAMANSLYNKITNN